MTVEQTALAVFVDRYTMQYTRRYPHPIELVWEAVTTSEHLNAWLLPVTRVERRLGGRCSFTWGGPEEDGMQVGEVTDFDPPRLVTYSFTEPVSSLRFDLEPDGSDGTWLRFTLAWPVGASDNEPEDYPGGDLPAGPDTAWRPGFLAGFHGMLDDLALFLDGHWTIANREAEIAAYPTPKLQALIDQYRTHLRSHCPPR
ncbi:MAG TPA: SRPBCC domain-containing protein [Acidimicrobiales bacterium]|jgi:uncharacterized protein YndB with AHSA1/START domain